MMVHVIGINECTVIVVSDVATSTIIGLPSSVVTYTIGSLPKLCVTTCVVAGVARTTVVGCADATATTCVGIGSNCSRCNAPIADGAIA